MRFSTLTTVVFAAGAFASPINKRDVVTDVVVDDVVVTDVIMTTVTAGQAPPSPVAQGPVPVVNVIVTTTSAPVVVQQPPQPPPTTSPSPSPSPSPVQPPVAVVDKVVAPPVSSAISSDVPSSTAAPSSSAAPSPSSSPSSGLPTTFVDNLDTTSSIYQQLALQHHNIHRANHSASALVWNSTLADYAKTTAETCIWKHSLAPGGGGYGQNIANGVAPGNISSILTNGLYNDEFDKYGGQWGNDNPNMGQFEGWGHLTQIIWAATTSVGCYTSSCAPPGADPQLCNPATGESYLKGASCGPNPGTPAFFTVCNYYPAGNVGGQYSNVQAPKGGKLVAMTKNGLIGM